MFILILTFSAFDKKFYYISIFMTITIVSNSNLKNSQIRLQSIQAVKISAISPYPKAIAKS